MRQTRLMSPPREQFRDSWPKHTEKINYIKVARYSFSESIPFKFEHKLRRPKQRFVKLATTVVLDKDENLLWSGLQRHRSCHSNEMTLLPILLGAVFLGTGNCPSFFQNRSRELFTPIKWSLIEICKSLIIEIFWDEVFMVFNTVKMDSLDVWPLSVENEALLTCNFIS